MEKERKKNGEEEDPIKVQKIEKDLKNLEQMFNLIIEHYEGEYQHKRRSRKNLKSRSGNRSMYTGFTGTDGYTIIEEYSFAEKSISLKKSQTPHRANLNKNNLLSPPNNKISGHHHIYEGSNKK